jgi:hypothetical protein
MFVTNRGALFSSTAPCSAHGGSHWRLVNYLNGICSVMTNRGAQSPPPVFMVGSPPGTDCEEEIARRSRSPAANGHLQILHHGFRAMLVCSQPMPKVDAPLQPMLVDAPVLSMLVNGIGRFVLANCSKSALFCAQPMGLVCFVTRQCIYWRL